MYDFIKVVQTAFIAIILMGVFALTINLAKRSPRALEGLTRHLEQRGLK